MLNKEPVSYFRGVLSERSEDTSFQALTYLIDHFHKVVSKSFWTQKESSKFFGKG